MMISVCDMVRNMVGKGEMLVTILHQIIKILDGSNLKVLTDMKLNIIRSQ